MSKHEPIEAHHTLADGTRTEHSITWSFDHDRHWTFDYIDAAHVAICALEAANDHGRKRSMGGRFQAEVSTAIVGAASLVVTSLEGLIRIADAARGRHQKENRAELDLREWSAEIWGDES